MNVINLDEMDKDQAKETRQALLDKYGYLRSIQCRDLEVKVSDKKTHIFFFVHGEYASIPKSEMPDFLAAIRALVDED